MVVKTGSSSSVRRVRKQTAAEPDYYQDVRELAERCLEWRAKTYQTAQITWVDNAL